MYNKNITLANLFYSMETKEYSLAGRVVEVTETKQISEKFKKREIVIETDGRYPQLVQFVFAQEKTSLLDDVQIGQNAEIFFNVRGRKWKDRYFVELSGWRIVAEKLSEPEQLPIPDEEDLPF